MDVFDDIVASGIDEKYRFSTYEEFEAIKSEAEEDEDVFLVEREESVDVKDISQLDLETIFEDIEIVKTSGDQVHVKYFAIISEKSSKKAPEYDVNSTIKFHVNWKNLNVSAHGMMIVEVPEDFKGDIKVQSVSGDVIIDEINGDKVTINTVSGDFDLIKSESETLKVSTVSGEVEIVDVSNEDLDIGTTSGNIDLKGYFEDMDINTVSGEVEIQMDQVSGNIEIDTTSGEVLINVEEADANIDFNSVSGDLMVAYDIDTSVDKEHKLKGQIGSGKFDIEVDTVSGDIDLR